MPLRQPGLPGDGRLDGVPSQSHGRCRPDTAHRRPPLRDAAAHPAVARFVEETGRTVGRVLADLYDGNHEAWRDLPFYQKRLLPLPPEPLRWLGYQAYTRLTGRSPRKRIA